MAVEFVRPKIPKFAPDPWAIQFDDKGRLRHLLTIEGLGPQWITRILDTAEGFVSVTDREIKKVPLLRGRTVVNLFFESSTRTRTTFELAAKRLSADVLNLNLATSATKKGESLLDTLHNIEAMQADMFVIRHEESGAAHFIARHVAPHVSVLNAGDGWHSHPTQALLDAFTVRRHKGDFAPLRIAIVGDVRHSRVARSQMHVFNSLNVGELRVIAPRTLLPTDVEKLGVRVFHDMREGLKDVDVIIMLRLQRERMESGLLPSEEEFYRLYGLTEEKLGWAKPDAIVMHPGPANRGVEIESTVADGPQSVILEQVSNGIGVRMAVMSLCMSASATGDASTTPP